MSQIFFYHFKIDKAALTGNFSLKIQYVLLAFIFMQCSVDNTLADGVSSMLAVNNKQF